MIIFLVFSEKGIQLSRCYARFQGVGGNMRQKWGKVGKNVFFGIFLHQQNDIVFKICQKWLIVTYQTIYVLKTLRRPLFGKYKCYL